jgi:hypothetical protein
LRQPLVNLRQQVGGPEVDHQGPWLQHRRPISQLDMQQIRIIGERISSEVLLPSASYSGSQQA